MRKSVTVEHAYFAMLEFLEDYYAHTHSEEIGAILGGLQVDEDGKPFDPAAWGDWIAAVARARERSN